MIVYISQSSRKKRKSVTKSSYQEDYNDDYDYDDEDRRRKKKLHQEHRIPEKNWKKELKRARRDYAGFGEWMTTSNNRYWIGLIAPTRRASWIDWMASGLHERIERESRPGTSRADEAFIRREAARAQERPISATSGARRGTRSPAAAIRRGAARRDAKRKRSDFFGKRT